MLLLGLLTACGPGSLPTSALGERSRELFRDFDADTASLPDTVLAIDELLGALDLEDGRRKRSFELQPLTADFRGDVTVPASLDMDEQFGFGQGALSRHDVEANLMAQSEPDQVCINADAVKCHRREDLSDGACFVDQTCDVWRTFNTVRIENALAKYWIEAYVDFRWVQLTDGRKAMVSRAWMEDEAPADSGKRIWNQRFAVDVWIPDPGDATRTRRWYATWLGGQIPATGEWLAKRSILKGIDEGFRNPDDWLDDPVCEQDSSECVFPD